MKRELWSATITKHYCPPWNCPICNQGTVRLASNSVNEHETAPSRDERSAADNWDPDWLEYVFTARAICNNVKCKQDFAIAGTGGLEPEYEEDGQTWSDYFLPRACFPMPHIINVPQSCPIDVKKDLIESFSLFWAHRSASANAIRYALEKLLTHQGVPKEVPIQNQPDKFHTLNLHQRIEDFTKSEPAVGSQLMALKWLGNAGSHGSEINREDLLDAFEILEYALEEILNNKSKKVAELAKRLAKKHS